MKRLIGLVVVLLMGCASTPPVVVAPKFPDAPGQQAMTACPTLKQLGDDPELSDVADEIIANYSSYYECSVKLDAWIEWYNLQKKIYEAAVK
jgi:hypothetical protein